MMTCAQLHSLLACLRNPAHFVRLKMTGIPVHPAPFEMRPAGRTMLNRAQWTLSAARRTLPLVPDITSLSQSLRERTNIIVR